jgi:hypothetical protein
MFDPTVGRFLSEDPLGFAAGDANLTRYVGNSPTNFTDPTGMSRVNPWTGIARILGKQWSEETCERAGKALAAELLQTLGNHHPNSQKAQEIIRALKKMGWVEGPLGKGDLEGVPFAKGGGLILREMENGERTGRFLQWHPGGGHHGPDPYWKFSSGESGTLRYLGGSVVAIAVAAIPGAAQAQEGDWNGAGRECAWSFVPGSWFSDGIYGFFSWMNDLAVESLYGDEYRQHRDDYSKEFWEKVRRGELK